MEIRKLTKKDLNPREIIPPVGKGSWVEPIKPIKLPDRKIVISTLEKMWFDLDSKSVLMGSINFITARLTGYKWFKEKIKVKNDQSLLGRLKELLDILINKLKGL